jgi:ribonucleoside-diphosphate reductase alpha chain
MAVKKNPYEGINWTQREAKIVAMDGTVKFQETVEFPDYFDDNSVGIVASKYLCNSAKKKEKSLKDLIDRVSDTITNWGEKDGYFANKKARDEFNYKLKRYQVQQYFAFNSPVYFNVGLKDNPQGSACFILDIQDNMDSIFDVAKLESRIFKQGSGSGMNISTLRSAKEPVTAGGYASGPVSFMKAHDTVAGVIKSGGTLRRSAKMVCMDVDHPDIEEFINCKQYEEEKLRVLRNAGIQSKPGCELGDEVFYQNTNISVRLTEEFMNAIETDGDFFTKFVANGTLCDKFKARDLLKLIAQKAWECADPGLMYHDNTNKWHTCKNSGPIVASNPCGEFVFINNSACNLASINLLKVFNKTKCDFETFSDVIEIVTLAQEIIIDNASYPDSRIRENSIKFRPIGLGYTNLGALLMLFGFPYDSDEGRELAATVTAILTGVSYLTSSAIAMRKGPFSGFSENKEAFYEVMDLHTKAARENFRNGKNKELCEYALDVWEKVNDICHKKGPFRNAQTTLLAPTGTISYLMGAATTGIEPEFSHIKYKNLSGTDGGCIKLVNPILEQTLRNLGYTEKEVQLMKEEILASGHLENSQYINDEHLAIFDTSTKPFGGSRTIHYMGHIKMLAAVQPFLSGAISKTCNLPNEITVDEIYNIFVEGWKMGLKGITVYRDGSKTFQALSTSSKDEKKEQPTFDLSEYFGPDEVEEVKNQLEIIKQKVVARRTSRKKLPDERKAVNHKFNIGTTKGYITCGLYDSGEIGEVFVKVAKQGSTLAGLLDALATITSISLQYGVPLKVLVKKLMNQRFDPMGFTSNENIRTTSSIVDYLFKYLGIKFLNKKDQEELGIALKKKIVEEVPDQSVVKQVTDELLNTILGDGDFDLPSAEDDDTQEYIDVYDYSGDSVGSCPECGSLLVRKGSCDFCVNCAYNGGSCG